jgi:hypothetical protein
MSRSTLSAVDLELNEIREAELRLAEQVREAAKLPERLAREQRERDTTMPPLAEIEERRRMKEYDQKLVSRGEFKNVMRDQNRSLVLLMLLIAATGTLIWWGMQLMRG